MLSASATALAFDPWNIRHFPGSSVNSTMVAKVGTSATMTWQAVDQFGWSGWRQVVSDSLDTSSSDSRSLGRILNLNLAKEGRGSITIREAKSGENPDMIDYAVPTAFLEAKCGEWATACVYLLNPLPIPAYFKAANMTQWGYSSQAPVVRHETFHPLARACDQYRGGCPRAADGVYEASFVCTGNPDTLMDCGGAAPTATDFDYQTFVLAYKPTTPFLQMITCNSTGYDPCTGRWKQPDGFSWDPISKDWYNPQGTAEWSACSSNKDRFNHYQFTKYGASNWYDEITGGFFDTSRGYWSYAPAC